MRVFLRDMRYAVRALRKKPVFLGMALFLLCLGTGVNTLLFSVVDSVLLRSLPYENAQQLCLLWESSPVVQNSRDLPVTPADFLEIKKSNRTFQDFAAFRAAEFNLTSTDEPERVAGARISTNLFSLLNVQPRLGRTFFPQEEQAGSDSVVVISDALWKRRFGSDGTVLGKTLRLDEKTYTIVGVMPPGFEFPRGAEMPAAMRFSPATEIWKPLGFTPEEYSDRADFRYAVLGRLKSQITLQQARTDLDSTVQAINGRQSRLEDTVTSKLVPLQESVVHDIRPAIMLLWIASFFVLLIACFNVASLLVIRAIASRRELAVKAALGASRRQLIQQLLIESTLLTVTGALLGFVSAAFLLRLLVTWMPANMPRAAEIHINPGVFVLSVLTSLVTGLIFGLVPAKAGVTASVEEVLKSSGTGATYSVFGRRLQKTLMIFQVAASQVLVVCALLVVFSFSKLTHVDLGFATDNVLTMQVPLTVSQYPLAEKRKEFFQAVIEKVQLLPGVRHVAVIDSLPLSGGGRTTNTTLRGERCNSEDNLPVEYRFVSPEYFRVMGIPLELGRTFVPMDSSDTTAIINETFAQQCWPGQSPIGKQFKTGRGQQGPWKTVVGIVKDVRSSSPAAMARPQAYLPYFDSVPPVMTLAVQTAGEPLSLVHSVENEIWSVDKHQPVYKVRSTRQLFAETLSKQRFETFLLVSFAIIALSLACAGVYAVASYSATERRLEMGIRIAFGAERKSLLALMMKDALGSAVLGIAGGLLASFVVSRYMQSELYQVTGTSPVILISTSVIMLAVAALASYLPAHRASVVDPMQVLRQE